MKITNLMSMLAAATAVGFCMSATAGDGQSGKLVLTDPVTNVNVTAESEPAVGGSWNTAPAVVGEVGEKYFEIETDGASTNVFVASEGVGVTSGKVVKCEFVLKPSPVSYTDSLPLPDSEAQVAFCIATNTSDGATLQAYVNGGWQELTGAVVPTGDDPYTLTITLDYSGSTKYAKFAIGETVLTNNSNQAWLEIGTSKNNVSEYCFVGSGSLKSILTTGQDITAEIIPVPEAGNVTIPEAVVQNIDVPSGSSLAEELAKTDTAGSNKVIDNVVLGLRDGTGLKDDGKLVAKNADAGSADATKIKLGLNAVAPEGTGATVTYQLMGSNNGSDFENVGGSVSNPDDLAIPLNGGTVYKYYKVKATITYPNN